MPGLPSRPPEEDFPAGIRWVDPCNVLEAP